MGGATAGQRGRRLGDGEVTGPPDRTGIPPVLLATVWEGLYADALERGEEAADWEAHIEYVAMLAEAVVDGDLPL